MVNAAPKEHHAAVRHAPLLHNPWFAENSEGVTLHRYFDDQFVPRFTQEAMSGRLTATRAQEWYNSDRFGRKDLPTLRLPMHQTFYIACCEVSCDNPGQPAYDPKRIRSAGFVIRRRAEAGVQRWMIHEGQALGWQSGPIPDHEPDDYRRFVNSKLISPRYPEPSYSGEESYPLHPLLIRDKKTKRSHTLLWGYLPLGGSYRLTNNATEAPHEASAALSKELSWPFGQNFGKDEFGHDKPSRPWATGDNRPVFHGYVTKAFYELLELLVIRYRVFDEEDDDNSELRNQLKAIHFYPPLVPYPLKPFDPYAVPPAAKGDNLLEWIEDSRDSILEWLSKIATGKETMANALPQNPLPHRANVDADGNLITTLRNDDLYITEQQAAVLRDALLLRGGRAMVAVEDGLAMPRFGQGDDDQFFILSFVRWQDECGCEKIHWGQQRSIDFRVVSPFDPEAQRPRAVILPGLDDLKRGTARGVSLLAPKSLADALRSIKPTMDMGKGGPGNPAGLCWSFSLSIPVVTICAMILLMILISLLDIIFRWLPWAILALPRLCGKMVSPPPPAQPSSKDDY